MGSISYRANLGLQALNPGPSPELPLALHTPAPNPFLAFPVLVPIVKAISSGCLPAFLLVLAEDAIKAALADYRLKQEPKKGEGEK